MQMVRYMNGESITVFSLPSPHEQILPGVKWGRADEIFSSAYWSAVGRMMPDDYNYREFRLGRALREEIAACLLGGYGIPAEIGLAAFSKVQGLGLLAQGAASEGQILEALLEPLITSGGRTVSYRFARQKAKYLARVLRILDCADPPEHSGRLLRDWLIDLPGIGWKTASWIARNWLGAEDVAILDIHIMRAGVLAGIFDRCYWYATEYLRLEATFLAWARALDLSPAHLDVLIWREMRNCAKFAAGVARQSGRPPRRYLHRQRDPLHP